MPITQYHVCGDLPVTQLAMAVWYCHRHQRVTMSMRVFTEAADQEFHHHVNDADELGILLWTPAMAERMWNQGMGQWLQLVPSFPLDYPS